MKNRQHSILQNSIYALIWLILLVIPVFGYRDSVEGINWDAVLMFWARMLPFLLLFAINNYLLIPRWLAPRKYLRYLCSVIVVIAAVLVLNHIFVRAYLFAPPSFRVEKSQVAVEKPQTDTLKIIAQSAESKTEISAEKPRRRHFRPAMWQYLLMDGIVSILLVGTNAAICLMFLSIADRVRMREMESQSLKTELDYLKSQINPHFFMNTLNNIHALVDIDAERAKESIIELSKIMRYVLYDTNLSLVPLAKEVEFIENYVCLMRMRYTDEVRIATRYPNPLPDVQLPPLMLVALIENAFKHGISYQKESFVDLSIEMEDEVLIYTVENSYFGEKKTKDPNSGVGLSNLRKRLELLFGDRGELAVSQVNDRYIATLKLRLR